MLLPLFSQSPIFNGSKPSPPPKLYPAFERCRRCLPLHVQLLQETSRRFLVLLLPFLVLATAVSQSLFRRLSDVFGSKSPRISPSRLLIIPDAMVRQLRHLDDSERGEGTRFENGRTHKKRHETVKNRTVFFVTSNSRSRTIVNNVNLCALVDCSYYCRYCFCCCCCRVVLMGRERKSQLLLSLVSGWRTFQGTRKGSPFCFGAVKNRKIGFTRNRVRLRKLSRGVWSA